jgi:phosphatidylglycerophosphate synthase
VIARARIVVSDPDVARAPFCGRTLVERHEAHLRRAGVADIEIDDRAGRDDDCGVPCVVVAAERVFDPRLYDAAVRTAGSATFVDRGQPVGLDVIGAGAASALVDIDTLDPYSLELRRTLRPYWMAVHGPDDRHRVRSRLIESSYKGHQDIPAEFFNRPIESLVLSWTADTRITPNAITLVCNLVAYAVAALFAVGWYGTALAGALVVGILDGVDGRQARVQMRTTTFGALEHVLDKGYEIAWMIALAFSLSARFADRVVVYALAIWIGAYLADTGAYDVFKWRRGIRLDEATPADAAIRRVAGRRNVYVWMLIAGLAAGAMRAAFIAVTVWAVATALVHWLRAVTISQEIKRPGESLF